MRRRVFYLHVADSTFLEGAVLQVVGADVTIFTPMTWKHTADTRRTPEREADALIGQKSVT